MSPAEPYIPSHITLVSDEAAQGAYSKRYIAILEHKETITYAALLNDVKALKAAQAALRDALNQPLPFSSDSFIAFKQTMLRNDPVSCLTADIATMDEVIQELVANPTSHLNEKDILLYQEGKASMGNIIERLISESM